MYRILRSIKNRFGSTSELGIYEMQQTGLRQVSNPSELLLSQDHEGLSGVAISSAIEGVRPFLVETQALVSSAAYGTPQRSATGFDQRRLNMLLAVLEKRVGFKLIQKDVFVNIAGGLRVTDLAMDLSVIAAVLSSNVDTAIEPGWCMAGEVGLSGEVRPINRIEQRIAEAEKLGFTDIILPNPEKKRSKTNNRKVVFDSACRTMFLDICKRHGLEIDEEPSYGGRQYLEKQDYIRMKQKEEIAVQQEMLNQQRDKVNANHLELARQSNHVRANEKVIQSQKEKIEQQEKEFKENFISNSDRILSQGELIEEQREELQQLTLRIEDVETLLDEVSSEAYDKAVDKVAEETMRATRKDDIRLAEDSKRWIQSPERKASRKEKEYAINRLDGLIKKIEYAMEKAVVRVVRQLKQPEKKKAVVEEIKKEVKPSIREKLALNVAKIQREEAERKQLNKGRSHSSDLEL